MSYKPNAQYCEAEIRNNSMQGNESFCCACGQRINGFIPYRGGRKNRPVLMEILDVVGSDPDNFSCPNCGAHDRERHLLLYLAKLKLLGIFSNSRVLHFAPEQWFSKMIEIQGPRVYVKADLYPQNEGVKKVNILDIAYSADEFDVVVANHVMEHVDDDLKALSELHRVLRLGGLAILQTPYSSKLHRTLADPGIDDDYCRLQVYGQEDHVRLYGQDIFDRFEQAGFRSLVVTHEVVLPEYSPGIYGVNVKEPFFLFESV